MKMKTIRNMILWKIFYTEIEACDSYDKVFLLNKT